MYIERTNALLSQTAGQGRDTILVIESRMLMRDFIMHVLKGAFPDHEVIDGRDMNEAHAVDGTRPRLAIIGQYADDLDGAPCELEAILERFGDTPVVLMAEDNDHSLQSAVAAGCRGFVPRSLSLDIAVAAFRLVLVGGTFFPRPLPGVRPVDSRPIDTQSVVAPATGEPEALARAPLAVTTISGGCATSIVVAAPALAVDQPNFTPREWQIVESLQSGKSNKIIAADLNLSENTVKVHVRHVMRKLRATNRTQAALRSQAAWRASG
ncbi:MAG: LuxR C-terminal-related transcriptional regulator [Beijerinckiaceae bacterium]